MNLKVVNMASRLQSHCHRGTIQVSLTTAMLIRSKYVCVARGDLDLKGIGKHPVYVVQVGKLKKKVVLVGMVGSHFSGLSRFNQFVACVKCKVYEEENSVRN